MIVVFGPCCFGVDDGASSPVSKILVHSVGSWLGLSWCGQSIAVLVRLKIDRVLPLRCLVLVFLV